MSLSSMVTTAKPVPVLAPPVGFDRNTSNSSAGSSVASSIVVTVIDRLVVSPSDQSSVPLVAVKSSGAAAELLSVW